ncbi:MAG TPA: Hsp70 family protein, partial [Pseudonocardia sp.]|nr:Hsp70 family protein [Pseudonocardia sp.]
MSYFLGVDVGTTRTAAAVGRPGGRPGESEIVSLGERSSAVPSVLHVADDGAVLVGDAAERRALSDPDHVVREFKRRIGDPTPLVIGGRPWTPEELSARLVRWVVERVAQREGGAASRIAVTHPASWGAHKKDRLGSALAAQGIPVSFLAEPQAAALHYAAAERIEAGSTIAVYDLGGGTFDAAVVHKDGAGFGLLGRPEGLERLGGVDFDEVIFEHVRRGLPEAFDGLDDADPRTLSAIAAIRRECVDAKEALSSDTEVSIPVLTPAAQGAVRLHRTEFEGLIRPQIEATVEALRRAVHSAGLIPAQLSAVLLVGGSSRIPLVASLVSEQLGRPVAVDADPKNAIALGAALSLTPAGISATGAAGRVPTPRPAPRPAAGGPLPGAFTGAASYSGATEVVRAAIPQPAPQPYDGSYDATVYGSARGGYGPGADGGATAFVGSPSPRAGATGSMVTRAVASPGRPLPYPDRPTVSAEDAAFDRPPGDSHRHTDDRPGRAPAALVGMGAAAAAVAVIGLVFLWPGQDPVTTDAGRFSPTPQGPVATTPLPQTTEPTPEPTEE